MNDLAVSVKAKRTEASRRQWVIRDAIQRHYGELVGRGQHDRAMLLEIALKALPPEAMTAIYNAVADDPR